MGRSRTSWGERDEYDQHTLYKFIKELIKCKKESKEGSEEEEKEREAEAHQHHEKQMCEERCGSLNLNAVLSSVSKASY